ncbi:hypothetical protein K2181_22305 [Clostridium estertheticum]|nr:hypothetical protein [Clostridium estertheticum]WLC80751.1 hypothetical protein KTC98_05565 [Clostridium estertheticum]
MVSEKKETNKPKSSYINMVEYVLTIDTEKEIVMVYNNK